MVGDVNELRLPFWFRVPGLTKLSDLDIQRQAMFSLLCADRLALCFAKLGDINTQPIPNEIASILDHLWEIIGSDSFGDFKGDIDLERKCEELLPDWESQDYLWKMQTLNAGAAVIYCLTLLRTRSVQCAIDASVSTVEALASYIRSTHGDAGLDLPAGEVQEHALMQKELHKQERDIIVLEGPMSINRGTIDRLREENQAYVVPVALN
jgi:hypothetical protein